jgi:hypothetical protein
MTSALLTLGLVLGLRHALEADHVAAVASLASDGRPPRQVVFISVAWGAGHAAVLLSAGAAVAYFDVHWPPWLTWLGEVTAGIVLVWIGVDAVRRARARPRLRAVRPVRMAATRALAIGGLHGLEGSGAAVLLIMPAVSAPSQAIGYLAAFGLGAIGGMLGCSLAVTAPLGLLGRRLKTSTRPLELGLGAASVAIGAVVYMRCIFK